VAQFLIQFYVNIRKYNTHFCSNIQFNSVIQLYSSGIASPIKRKKYYTSLVSFSIVSKLHQIICTCVFPLYSLSASSQYRCEVWGKVSMSMDLVGLCGIPIAVWQTSVFLQDRQALSLDVHSLVHNTAPWKNEFWKPAWNIAINTF